MPRREDIAERMAEAVVKRLTARKILEAKEEAAARAAVRQVLLEHFATEEQIEAEARRILQDHAKAIRESAADYRALLARVKEKLARERGFVL
jgi:hypothetical protein